MVTLEKNADGYERVNGGAGFGRLIWRLREFLNLLSLTI